MPALLYRPDQIEAQLDYVKRAARQLAITGSKVLVLGPSSHHEGYDTSVDMDADEWTAFLVNLRRLEGVVNDAGLETALHPHWGMAIETGIDRLLASSSVGLCLDTGHVYLAGGDPVDVARAARGRVLHVHLKDVHPAKAARVRNGEQPFRKSVIDGLFVPLGQGGVDIAGVIAALEANGYRGWYVLEQDVSLKGEPPVGEGPKGRARQRRLPAQYGRSRRVTPSWPCAAPFAGMGSHEHDRDGAVGFGWMGQAHSRAYRDIPVYFPETGSGRGWSRSPTTSRSGSTSRATTSGSPRATSTGAS